LVESIVSAFRHYPAEAWLIGDMLAGYADLELRLLGCVRYALGDDIDIAARILYRTRGEEARISIADGIIRTRFETAGLGTTTCEAIADMSWCRRIREPVCTLRLGRAGPFFAAGRTLVCEL
jgi:hypothetical protein